MTKPMKRREILVATGTAVAAAAAAPALAQLDRPAPSSPPPASAPSAPKSVVDELKTLLQTQAKQWSSGDIDGFCSHYADDCIFLSPGGVTKGRKEVLARYKKKYEDKAAMGTLTLEVMSARHDDKLASLALTYKLSYTDRQNVTGSSLIGVEHINGRWLIVHDASM